MSRTSFLALFRNRILAGILLVVPLAFSLWVAGFLYFKLTGWAVNVAEKIMPEPFPEWGHHCVRVASIVFIILLLFFVGTLARYKIFQLLINLTEWIVMKVPMLNTIYSTCRQIGNAVWAPQGGMFSKVVLFEYPRKGIWVIGFLTNENNNDHWELHAKTHERLISVFLPTTPNPTSGFLLFIPERDCIRLKMPVSEGMRLVISGGAISVKEGIPELHGEELQTEEPHPDAAQ